MPDIYEQLQTEADVEAEKIRPTKEESSLYGAKWLTVEELLTDDTGYQQFAVDSAKGGGGSNIPICKVTLQNTSPSSGNISIRLADNQFVLNENGTLVIEGVYYIGPNPGTTTIDFLIAEQKNPQSNEITHSACTGTLLHGSSEDYSDLISNLNNVSIMSVQLGDNNYGYAAIVLDITKPASLTYKTGFGTV